jgi:ubiquinone biosynthesis protein
MGDLPRLHEISSVFIRHGLGDVVHRIGIANMLERAGQVLNWGAKVESVRLEPPSACAWRSRTWAPRS